MKKTFSIIYSFEIPVLVYKNKNFPIPTQLVIRDPVLANSLTLEQEITDVASRMRNVADAPQMAAEVYFRRLDDCIRE